MLCSEAPTQSLSRAVQMGLLDGRSLKRLVATFERKVSEGAVWSAMQNFSSAP